MEPSSSAPSTQQRIGLLAGVGAYAWWALATIYFKAVDRVPPLEILAHRILWMLPLLAALLWWQRGFGALRVALGQPRQRWALAASTLFIAGNWLLLITAVVRDQVVAASLGYYINPLFSVVLGMVFLGERLRRLQVLSCVAALVGVVYIVLSAHLDWAFFGFPRARLILPQGGLAFPEHGVREPELWLSSATPGGKALFRR